MPAVCTSLPTVFGALLAAAASDLTSFICFSFISRIGVLGSPPGEEAPEGSTMQCPVGGPEPPARTLATWHVPPLFHTAHAWAYRPHHTLLGAPSTLCMPGLPTDLTTLVKGAPSTLHKRGCTDFTTPVHGRCPHYACPGVLTSQPSSRGAIYTTCIQSTQARTPAPWGPGQMVQNFPCRLNFLSSLRGVAGAGGSLGNKPAP